MSWKCSVCSFQVPLKYWTCGRCGTEGTGHEQTGPRPRPRQRSTSRPRGHQTPKPPPAVKAAPHTIAKVIGATVPATPDAAATSQVYQAPPDDMDYEARHLYRRDIRTKMNTIANLITVSLQAGKNHADLEEEYTKISIYRYMLSQLGGVQKQIMDAKFRLERTLGHNVG